MKRSFTVTELLVAIAIIVILAGILIGGMGYAGRRADDAKTISAIQTLSAALEAYRAEKGYYPPCTNIQEVKFYRKSGELYLVLGTGSNPPEFRFVDKQGKAFLDLNGITATAKDKAEAFIDAWGKALCYQCPGTHNKAAFDLSSYGSDGKIFNPLQPESNDNKREYDLDNISNWSNASQQ